jgi:hypothetical protein
MCPTLLSLSCGYCGNCGHTPKFCPTLSSNKKTEAKQMSKIQAMEKRELEEKNANKKKVQVQTNKFAAFDDDEDSDSEPEQTLPQVASKVVSASFADFPALAAPATKKQTLPAIKKNQPKSNILSALSQVCPEVSVAAKMPEVYIPKPVMSKLDRSENKEEFIERYMKEATSTKESILQLFMKKPSRLTIRVSFQHQPRTGQLGTKNQTMKKPNTQMSKRKTGKI